MKKPKKADILVDVEELIRKNKALTGAYVFIGIGALIVGMLTRHRVFYFITGLAFLLAAVRFIMHLKWNTTIPKKTTTKVGKGGR